jgi:hypothetical protein
MNGEMAREKTTEKKAPILQEETNTSPETQRESTLTAC